MQKIRLALLVLVVASLYGCAVGNTHTYDTARPEVIASSGSKLTVGVQDQRPYVVNGSKSPNFVGLSRGGFCNPFDVATTSGKPLADDFSKAIQNALQTKGVDVSVVSISAGGADQTVVKRLVTSGNRAILLVLREWKSDTYSNTALYYDVSATVFDAEGKPLSSKEIKGSDNLGGSAMNPPGFAKEAVPKAFQKKLEQLFSSPEIAKYL